MTSPPQLPTMTRRQHASSLTAAFGVAWTPAIVIALLWPASPGACAPHFINASNSTENRLQPAPTIISRCARLPHDVLWTRLKLAAPRLTLQSIDDDDGDDVEVSRTSTSTYESSPPGEFQSFRGYTTQTTTAPSASSRHRQHARRRRRGRWRPRHGERTARRRRPAAPGRHHPSTSWSCRLQKRWKRMSNNVFPAYILTGSCGKQQTCMLGMYACRARRYSIKVLRRINDDWDDGCRPVPVAGPDTVYEEAWTLMDVPVTVACECSRRRRSGAYQRRPTDNI